MKHRALVAFCLLAFGISWGIYATGKWIIGIQGPVGLFVVATLFMLGPAAAALLVRQRSGITWPQLGVVWKGIRWKWVGVAILLALVLPLGTLLFNWLLGDVLHVTGFGHTAVSKAMLARSIEAQLQASSMADDAIAGSLATLQDLPMSGAMLLLIMLAAGALAGCTVNLVFALGEELGWRGMLFHLTRRWPLAKHVLFTGFLWGLWHAPLILEGHNYPEHRWFGVLFMCLLTTAMALPLAWVRLRSICVWAAGAMHGTINGVAGTVALFSMGGHQFLGSVVGLSAILSLGAMTLFLFIFDPGFVREFRRS